MCKILISNIDEWQEVGKLRKFSIDCVVRTQENVYYVIHCGKVIRGLSSHSTHVQTQMQGKVKGRTTSTHDNRHAFRRLKSINFLFHLSF